MIKNWNKEFDKEFVDGVGWSDKHIYRDGGELHIKRVKQFIKSLINKKLEGLRMEEDADTRNSFKEETGRFYSVGWTEGYNKAVSENNKKIEEEKV